MEKELRVFTGYFADETRRIDLVLVLKDDSNANIDSITNTFLLNALKIGLEIELETGKMKMHQHLIFVKVHAPDSILGRYAETFNIQKCFKDSHVDFINADNLFTKYLKIILPFFFNKREREWVKLIRHQYPHPKMYSTFERSQIVYRILLSLPFGDHENFVGLERLLKRRLIIDAYALHDGPYFFLRKQDSENVVNARQILYTYWIGADALLKAQPLSLLQEYFGEKIAYYFAFCELFNRFLLLSCGASIVVISIAYNELNDKTAKFLRHGVKDGYCLNKGDLKDTYLCPRCRDFNICPFTKTTEHCKEATYDFMMETPRMIPYYIFIMIWGIVFVFTWRKREFYLSWLWESDNGKSSIPRPDHKVHFKTIKRSKVTGILTDHDSIFTKIFILIKSLFIMAVILGIIFPMTIFWANFQFRTVHKVSEKIKDPNKAHFVGLAVFSTIFVFVNFFLEKVMEIFSHMIVPFENHKTQNSYEKSLIEKQFGATFSINFSYFIFLAFIKGRLYTYPYDPVNWNSIGGIGIMNCGIFTCINEIGVLLIVVVLFRSIIFNSVFALFRCTTDYTTTRTINANVPCWEREYMLNNVDDQYYLNQFKDLVMQFSLSLLFIGAFPLATIAILVGNVLHMRYNAWFLLLGSRRPLLHNSLGVSSWRHIMTIIAFASVITCVLMMALISRAAYAENYEYFGSAYDSEWVSFYSSQIDLSDYEKGAAANDYKNYNGYKPSKCVFFGNWQLYKEKMVELNYNSVTDNIVMQKLILFQHVIIILVFVISYLMSKDPKAVEETVAIEKRIKEQCYVRQMRNETNLN